MSRFLWHFAKSGHRRPLPCRLSAFITRWLTIAVVLLFIAGSVAAVEPPASFIRLADDADGAPAALQVVVARYLDDRGRNLDLVGAVHVADREYFVELNRRFANYDTVLYELVGDPDGGGGPASPGMALVGLLQGGMKDALGLAFQLDEIDYGRANFVHADMTPAEFSASMAERNESMVGTFVQMWAVSSAAQAAGTQPPEAALLRILLASDRQLALKQTLAESLVDQQMLLNALAGKNGSTLITERNRKALAVLERELASGANRLALFYGAGHMPDFHRRLTAEHGFRLENLEWVDAWDLR